MIVNIIKIKKNLTDECLEWYKEYQEKEFVVSTVREIGGKRLFKVFEPLEFKTLNIFEEDCNMIEENKDHAIRRFQKEYFFLSNYHDTTIKMNGCIFKNAESALYSFKNPANKKRFELISPREAKRISEGLKVRKDWEKIKDKTLLDIIDNKFTQNEYIQMKLIATGLKYLENGNMWHDNYYGNCYCEECKGIEGENVLGKILMKVRERHEPINIVKDLYCKTQLLIKVLKGPDVLGNKEIIEILTKEIRILQDLYLKKYENKYKDDFLEMYWIISFIIQDVEIGISEEKLIERLDFAQKEFKKRFLLHDVE